MDPDDEPKSLTTFCHPFDWVPYRKYQEYYENRTSELSINCLTPYMLHLNQSKILKRYITLNKLAGAYNRGSQNKQTVNTL